MPWLFRWRNLEFGETAPSLPQPEAFRVFAIIVRVARRLCKLVLGEYEAAYEMCLVGNVRVYIISTPPSRRKKVEVSSLKRIASSVR